MPAEGTVRDRGEAGFHLIETMRWEPGTGLLRRELHMERLGHSARVLGFAVDMARVGEALLAAEASTSPQRVRLAVERDGRCAVEARPFTPQAKDTVWRLRIAATRLDSTDPLLAHKTSLRDAYEAARAEFPESEADEVLLLNQKGELCEGTITSLFVETGHGMLATPPLSSGLLAGVLRAELVGRGIAGERVLRAEDIGADTRLFVGNSLRGLIEARLLPDDGP